MKIAFVIISLIISTFLFAEDFNIDIDDNETATIVEKNIVFLGHTTSIWDRPIGETSSGETIFKTKNAVRKLIKLGKRYNFTTMAMLYPAHLKTERESNKYYFIDDELDYAVLSVGGQHELIFPNIRNIFYVGGNMGRCLCESIRDVAEGFYDTPNFTTVNFYILRDGTYNDYPKFNNLTEENAKHYVERFFVPAFKCGPQNWSSHVRTKMPGVAMDVYYDDKSLGKYDLEPRDELEYEMLEQKINVHFIDSSMIEKKMLEL